jgi:hypothetical protein
MLEFLHMAPQPLHVHAQFLCRREVLGQLTPHIGIGPLKTRVERTETASHFLFLLGTVTLKSSHISPKRLEFTLRYTPHNETGAE